MRCLASKEQDNRCNAHRLLHQPVKASDPGCAVLTFVDGQPAGFIRKRQSRSPNVRVIAVREQAPAFSEGDQPHMPFDERRHNRDEHELRALAAGTATRDRISVSAAARGSRACGMQTPGATGGAGRRHRVLCVAGDDRCVRCRRCAVRFGTRPSRLHVGTTAARAAAMEPATQVVATEIAASRAAAIKPDTQVAATEIAASNVAVTPAGTAAPLDATEVSDPAPTGSQPVAETT
jgi:hypothetical protein